MKHSGLKTPIRYYGGKQRIAKQIVEILETIPHKIYCEPFAGGLAVLFAKPIKQGPKDDYIEVINDTNYSLVTFYKVAREQPDLLRHWIEFTPYSSFDRKKALQIYKDPSQYTEIEVAWSFYVCCNTCFSGKIGGGFSYSHKVNNGSVWNNRKKRLPECFNRLKDIVVESMDALDFIKKYDHPNTLFYCDPPYPGSHQGHYSGYTIKDLQNLCDLLGTIQGSYVLSGYSVGITPKNFQNQIEKNILLTGNLKKAGIKRDTRNEVLWVYNNSLVSSSKYET